MLSKAQIKYIRSLSHQKYREEYNVFTAEGDKIASELLLSNETIELVLATEDWAGTHLALINQHPEAAMHTLTDVELEQISMLQTPNQVMLVVKKPEMADISLPADWFLVLDNIQDPGNMGTMMRIADWFGIGQIICSPGCADTYNPKVVQAAMGAHIRVKTYKTELASFLEEVTLPLVAATLSGENIYTIEKPQKAGLIIGNESRGVSDEVLRLAKYQVSIPRRGGAESLNAAVSAGIICSLMMPMA